jgi:hypothetical protein
MEKMVYTSVNKLFAGTLEKSWGIKQLLVFTWWDILDEIRNALCLH